MNNNGLYNGISVFFTAMTILVIVVVAFLMSQPPPDDGSAVAALPTERILPSATPVTPSDTPRPTLPPTFTPTATDTSTPTATLSETPTDPPTATITDTPGPAQEPSSTPTPEETATPTITPTPSGPTAVPTPTEQPFLFNVPEGQIVYQPNSVNSAGCAWQGIGGRVFDMNRVESGRQFQVRVFNESFESVTTTGSNSFYGTLTGWEVPVSNQITQATYFVRLETLVGTPVSPNIQVNFPGDCSTNSVIITFVQQRPFGPPA